MGLTLIARFPKFNAAFILSMAFYLYILLKPFYFWSSGLPQVSDLLIVLVFPLLVYSSAGSFTFASGSHKQLFVFSFIFVFYCFIVNAVWSIKEGNIEPLLYSFYLFFNLYVVFFIYYITMKCFLSYEKLVFTLFLSSAFLFFYTVLNWEPGFRQIATFNNPNQLGAYAMLSSVIVIYIYGSSCFNLSNTYRILIRLLIFINLALVVFSFSAGAIFATLLSLIFLILLKYKKFIPLIFLCLSIFSSSFLVLYNSDSAFVDVVNSRIEKKESGPSIFYERGYDRMQNHLELNLFGAGEGLRYRFNSYIINSEYQLEIHSTIGTLVFSYGILAFFYLIFLIMNVTSNFRYGFFILLLFSLLPYLLTHNLLRHSFLWIFILLPVLHQAFVYSLRYKK